jgi:hypothetical protein
MARLPLVEQMKGSFVAELRTAEVKYEAAPVEKQRNSKNKALAGLPRQVSAVKGHSFLIGSVGTFYGGSA